MSTVRPIVRIAKCVTVGGASGAVVGVCLALLYETLQDPPSVIRLPGLLEVVMAIFFCLLGVLMGGIIAGFNLGKLSAVTIGVVIGIAFAAFWFTFVIAVPSQKDLALATAVVPMMALVGLLGAIVCHALQKRREGPG